MSVEVFRPARSSFIGGLRYDSDSGDLTIDFTDGTSFVYSGVSPATYRNFCLAPSLGSFFHRYIKDAYTYEQA